MWADHKELVAEGPDDELTPDDIDELLTLHLGSGWTLAARPRRRRDPTPIRCARAAHTRGQLSGPAVPDTFDVTVHPDGDALLRHLDQLDASADDDDDTESWLSIPGFRESLMEAEADYAAGRTYGEDEIRARFGLPRRDTDQAE